MILQFWKSKSIIQNFNRMCCYCCYLCFHLELNLLSRIDHIYSPKEREVFRLFLEAVVRLEPYGNLSTTDALNIPVPNMKIGDMEDLIDKLCGDHWFIDVVSCSCINIFQNVLMVDRCP